MNEKYKSIVGDINTYPKMNETIKDLCSTSDEGFNRYILARIIELEQALEFYADEEHYKDKQISKALCDADGVYISNDEYLPSIIYLDKGETARKALDGEK